MTSHFKSSRENGKSDRTIILEMVRDATPGTVFTFDEILSALRGGTDRVINVSGAGAAVRAANPTILREQQRCLHSVKGVGYRVAHAGDHQPLAIAHRRSADRKMRKGLATLQNVRWDEMTQAQREAHTGTLLVLGAQAEMIKAADARMDRFEGMLAKILKQSDSQGHGSAALGAVRQGKAG